jgi:hypothetical protein
MATTFQPDALIALLDRTPAALRSLVGGLTREEAIAQPNEHTWSIVEIISHLVDEETDDFRTRLKMTFEDASARWPGIDPEAASVDRDYRERDLGDSLSAFERERGYSLAWLRGLGAPDWDAAYEHLILGPVTAGDLLSSWAAHDQLHLRQIAKRLYELAEGYAGPYSTRYAGPLGS